MQETENEDNKRIELTIEGMSCVSCAQNIEKALKNVEGVKNVSVFFATEMATIEVENTVGEEILIAAVQKAGYRAYHKEKWFPKQTHIEEGFWAFAFSALFSTPFLLQMLWNYAGVSWEIPGVIQGILATIVQIAFGWRFYEGAYHSLRSLSANMDLLIAIGTTAAYLFSIIIFFFELPQHMYFESSSLIITFVLLGRWLESRSKSKSSEALFKLMELQPKIARVEVDGNFIDKNVNEIQVGDIFLVRPGESVSVDGEVVEGESYIDESLLTGESKPILKTLHSKIFGATVNQNGLLKAKAIKVGSETALSTIIRLVEDAQNSKAPIQTLADKVSGYFVPAVMGFSLLTLILWGFFGDYNSGIVNAVSVLVIACPCALGLATPTVIVVASGLAAGKGILFRNGSAIESAGKITTILLDKTGTLTEGKPQVVEVYPRVPENTLHLLKLALTLENSSQHPISEAITKYALKQGLRPLNSSSYLSIPGKGVSAEIEGKTYYIGSEAFAREKFPEGIYDLKNEDQSYCLVWNDKEILGEIVVADPIRFGSKQAIDRFKKLGIFPIMITGDNFKTAKSVAKQVDIEIFEAEVLPENKALKVKEKMQVGLIVGMIGDGINDAPALAAADVGFAMSSGSDIAMESADVTLISSDLNRVVDAIELSKTSLLKIKQNLFFAFLYNTLGIPLAAFGFLNPALASLAMALSSICVVSNALLLKKES